MQPNEITPEGIAISQATGQMPNAAGVAPTVAPTPQTAPAFQTPVVTQPTLPVANPATAGTDPNAALITQGNASPQTAPTMASLIGAVTPQTNTSSALQSVLPNGSQISDVGITASQLPPELTVNDANTIAQQTGAYSGFNPANPPSELTPAQAQQVNNYNTLNGTSTSQDTLSGIFNGTTQSNSLSGIFGQSATPTANVKVSGAEKTAAKSAIDAATTSTFGADQVQYMDSIINRESGFNPQAQNPTSTASGLGQFLDSTTANPVYGINQYKSMAQAPLSAQVQATINYVKSRYGTPEEAWNHEVTHGWY